MAFISKIPVTKTLNHLFHENRIPKISELLKYVATYSTYSVPHSAQVIICGAGAVGNSVAYHLLKNDWNDIIVLEQSK